MKKLFCVLVCLGVQFGNLKAQHVTITPNGITPTQGTSYPRISYDAILAISSPIKGDMAYDITFDCLRVYNGQKWLCTYQNPKGYVPNNTAIASAGGTGSVYAIKNAIDAAGNVYVTGYFLHKANFSGTSKTSVGNEDIFVAKYNSSGVLLWVQTFGGNDTDFANDIAVDASGNVYVTGFFWYTATFGSFTRYSAGLGDAYLMKLNSSGVVQWVQTGGGSDGDNSNSIALDAYGAVYITGTFGETIYFGESSYVSTGENDVFVAKYATNGELQWVQVGTGALDAEGKGIALDASGNVYVTGYFNSSVTFGTIAETSIGSSDIFVAKFDTYNMNWAWVTKAGSTSSDSGNDIAVDASGNAYITGSIGGHSYFGAYTRPTQSNSEDIFVAKYDNAGNILWVQTAGGSSSDYSYGISLDAAGSAYITGSFYTNATFSGTPQTAVGGFDIFLAKYSTDGAFQWVQSAGSINNDWAYGIAIDGPGNTYLTGTYRGPITFGFVNLTTTNNVDSMFLVRMEK